MTPFLSVHGAPCHMAPRPHPLRGAAVRSRRKRPPSRSARYCVAGCAGRPSPKATETFTSIPRHVWARASRASVPRACPPPPPPPLLSRVRPLLDGHPNPLKTRSSVVESTAPRDRGRCPISLKLLQRFADSLIPFREEFPSPPRVSLFEVLTGPARRPVRSFSIWSIGSRCAAVAF